MRRLGRSVAGGVETGGVPTMDSHPKTGTERAAGAMPDGDVPDAALLQRWCDGVDRLKVRLRPMHRRMLELRLEGHSFEEIAAVLGCSERGVRKVITETVMPYLERRLAATVD